MIVNVSQNTFNLFRSAHTGPVFYFEKEESIELYLSKDSFIIKTAYQKIGQLEDLTWRDSFLKDAFEVLSIEESKVEEQSVGEPIIEEPKSPEFVYDDSIEEPMLDNPNVHNTEVDGDGTS